MDLNGKPPPVSNLVQMNPTLDNLPGEQNAAAGRIFRERVSVSHYGC